MNSSKDWKEFRLGDLTTWASGTTPSKQNPSFWGGNIPWISASSMKQRILSSSENMLTEEGLKNGGKSCKKDDILLLVRGSELHKSIPIGIASKTFAFNQDVKAIRTNSEKLDQIFLYYLFKGNKSLLLKLVEYTGIGAGKLDIPLLQNLKLFLPSLDEQKKISNFMNQLDEKIEINIKTHDTLEDIAKALFKSWFIDFDPVKAKMDGRSTGLPNEISDLFPDSFEDSELGKIPGGWFCSTFSEFMTQKKEKIGQRKATILSAVNSGELVPSDKYFNKKVYSKDTAKYIAVDKYDIAYNPSRINIGSIGIHYDDYLGAVSPIYNVVTPNPGWHWYSLMSIKRDYFNKNVQVLASGSVRQSLSIDDFLSISVVTPPSPNSLVSYFNKVFDLFLQKQNNLNEERRCLENISKTILPELIAGELRIPDAEKILEEAGI